MKYLRLITYCLRFVTVCEPRSNIFMFVMTRAIKNQRCTWPRTRESRSFIMGTVGKWKGELKYKDKDMHVDLQKSTCIKEKGPQHQYRMYNTFHKKCTIILFTQTFSYYITLECHHESQ